MAFIIQYVANYAPWIYAICGLVALYHIYKIWLVRAERRQAVFSLEREKATRDTFHIFAVAMILLLSMGLTYFVSTVLATAIDPLVSEALQPNPGGLQFMPTPTHTPLPSTPTPTIAPPTLPPQSVETVEPEPQEEAQPEAPVEPPTPTPQPVVVQTPSCPDQRAVLLRPGNNEVVNGTVNVIGTARHENFQYYKLEYAPGPNASGGFGYLGGGNNQVENNLLAGIDTTTLGNGQWTLRLIVVDQTGNFPPPCQITISVQN